MFVKQRPLSFAQKIQSMFFNTATKDGPEVFGEACCSLKGQLGKPVGMSVERWFMHAGFAVVFCFQVFLKGLPMKGCTLPQETG